MASIEDLPWIARCAPTRGQRTALGLSVGDRVRVVDSLSRGVKAGTVARIVGVHGNDVFFDAPKNPMRDDGGWTLGHSLAVEVIEHSAEKVARVARMAVSSPEPWDLEGFVKL